MVRVILIQLVENVKWVNFTRDYPYCMTQTSFLPVQFVIYNIIPYLTLIYLHWFNFRAKPEDDGKPLMINTGSHIERDSNFSSILTSNRKSVLSQQLVGRNSGVVPGDNKLTQSNSTQ